MRPPVFFHINYSSDDTRSAGDCGYAMFLHARNKFLYLMRTHPEAEMVMTKITTSPDGYRSSARIAVYDPSELAVTWEKAA